MGIYENEWLLVCGFFFAVISIYFHVSGKNNASLVTLFFSAVAIRVFMCHIDPFLHDWDERFHALVALNMMDAPFQPILKPLGMVPYDYTSWTNNHIWVHKQPLFMWQMALSMKLFGVSEFSIRYPSALAGALMVVFTYRITWLLAKDRMLAYTASLLLCFAGYQLELISGFIGMDHNDVSFGFYVLGSIWAYAESLEDRRLFWVLLIGLFAGCAILNKWLTGLIVFSGWGVNLLLAWKDKGGWKEVLRMAIALLACAVVFVPWQLYISSAFPMEARHEYAYNAKHIAEAVEHHSGDHWFYFDRFRQYFGLQTWGLMLVGAGMFLLSGFQNSKLKWALAVIFGAVFCFFSLIVKTKMQSYVYMVAPIGYIAMAVALVKPLQFFKVPKWLSMLPVVACCVLLFNYQGIRNYFHNPTDPYRIYKVHNATIYKNIRSYIPKGVVYVLNIDQFEEVDIMFYNKGLIGYYGNLDRKYVEEMKQKKLPVAVFRNHSGWKNEDYFAGYSQMYLIPADISKPQIP